jgi:hypothetical protein
VERSERFESAARQMGCTVKIEKVAAANGR